MFYKLFWKSGLVVNNGFEAFVWRQFNPDQSRNKSFDHVIELGLQFSFLCCHRVGGLISV
jgi:hypothetical protein